MCDPAVLSPILLFGAKGPLGSSYELHLFSLHHVYLSRINSALTAFADGWNMHGIRTEKNMSPLQLFNAGALLLQNSGLTALDFFDSVGDDYGVDPDRQISTEQDPEVRIEIINHLCICLHNISIYGRSPWAPVYGNDYTEPQYHIYKNTALMSCNYNYCCECLTEVCK